VETIAALLARETPDVVALQEIDAYSAVSGSFDHLALLADRAGYAHQQHGLHFTGTRFRLPIRYGTALLSRLPLAQAESVEFEAEPLDAKGFVAAEIEFDGRRLLMVSAHLDFKLRSIRRRQVEDMIAFIKARGLPAVIMGDFNSDWAEGSAVRMLADACLLQAWIPEAGELPTYPADAPASRIDWILVSPELAFRSYAVWEDVVSDHRAVAAELYWR
jgi:endonuclease/exonuclease/phosphatase family metal-dependent hydrolase